MKNFLILTNEKKDPGLRISKKIQDYIEKQGGISQRMCDFTRHVQKDMNCITKDTECVIVLGGDGTMLHAARLIVDHDIPMVGVNLGTLGFLTEIELSKLYDGLDGLLNDTFQIEERMMLDGRVIHADHETDHLPALNDVVIARSGFSRIISFRIMVNGKLLDVYEADGIIVSTPTGSTGYNLSAGGPVVNPKANVILITPICPHSLQSNSLVLSPEDEIDIYIENVRESQLEEAYVTFDGQVARKLQPGDVLQVRKSKKIARIIKVKGDSFYRILRIKDRQEAIIELIQQYPIETQEELLSRLNQIGFKTTQATISRDIRELALIKKPDADGKQIYCLIDQEDETSRKYQRILAEAIISMELAENMLVVKTVSGMAMASAAALDSLNIIGMVGTIAGDDTIMCVMKDKNIGRTAIAEIDHMIKKLKE